MNRMNYLRAWYFYGPAYNRARIKWNKGYFCYTCKSIRFSNQLNQRNNSLIFIKLVRESAINSIWILKTINEKQLYFKIN